MTPNESNGSPNPQPETGRSPGHFGQMPSLIKFGRVLCALGALYYIGRAVWVSTSGFGTTRFKLAGRNPQPGLTILCLSYLVCAAILIAILIGFSQRKPWARYVAMSWWLWRIAYAASMLGAGLPSIATSHALQLIRFISMPAMPVIAAWYFFRKKNVVDYYRSLESGP